MKNIIKQIHTEIEDRYKECTSMRETELIYVRLLIDIKEALGRISESELFNESEQRAIQREAYQHLADHHSKVERYVREKGREQFVVFPK